MVGLDSKYKYRRTMPLSSDQVLKNMIFPNGWSSIQICIVTEMACILQKLKHVACCNKSGFTSRGQPHQKDHIAQVHQDHY